MTYYTQEADLERLLGEFHEGIAEEGLEEYGDRQSLRDMEALFAGVLACLDDELYLQEFMRYGSLYRQAAELAARKRESGVPMEMAMRHHILMRDAFWKSRRSEPEKGGGLKGERRAIQCFNNMLEATVAAYQEGLARSDALRDPVTGVFNREYFMTRIEEEIKRSERYLHDMTVMLVDVRSDLSPESEEGAELMRAVARVLRRNSRASDVLARVEPLRFAMLVPETGSEPSTVAAGRLERQVAYYLADMGEPFGGAVVQTGTASYPEHALDGEALFNEALENLREETGGD